MQPVPADQKRTEITPMPHSSLVSWNLDTPSQQRLSDLIALTPLFIPTLREFALSLANDPSLPGERAAGIHTGARAVVEQILNMTHERVKHFQAVEIQRRAGQVPVGLPPDRRLRKPPVLKTNRLSGPVTAEEKAALAGPAQDASPALPL